MNTFLHVVQYTQLTNCRIIEDLYCAVILYCDILIFNFCRTIIRFKILTSFMIYICRFVFIGFLSVILLHLSSVAFGVAFYITFIKFVVFCKQNHNGKYVFAHSPAPEYLPLSQLMSNNMMIVV